MYVKNVDTENQEIRLLKIQVVSCYLKRTEKKKYMN